MTRERAEDQQVDAVCRQPDRADRRGRDLDAEKVRQPVREEESADHDEPDDVLLRQRPQLAPHERHQKHERRRHTEAEDADRVRVRVNVLHGDRNATEQRQSDDGIDRDRGDTALRTGHAARSVVEGVGPSADSSQRRCASR
jgi:hypothetical protein